jgi:hypothetical protein
MPVVRAVLSFEQADVSRVFPGRADLQVHVSPGGLDKLGYMPEKAG